MSILNNIKSAEDLKLLSNEQLVELCREIRERLIHVTSKTGGHLASNLGVVELTVALDKVYDPMKDRIVFDVGHQCYVHKILTGRNDEMETLRQFGGLSGFPKPNESEADAFIAGHASNSISVALGMARARTLQKQDYEVVTVIGDGALTGGLAYEGLSNAAMSKEKITIILNDNEMSISENVGGVAKMISKLRTKDSYLAFKRGFRRTLGRIKPIHTVVYNTKEAIKDLLIKDNSFTVMGFDYIGPIDGHDISELTATLEYVKTLKKPVLVHVMTKKGKGYAPAEKDPSLFHGIGPFNIETGQPVKDPNAENYSIHFSKTLSDLANKDSRIVGITAAMEAGTGLDHFKANHPDRFFDVGIAEATAVTMAAGMAKQGMLPVVAIYSTFLQRAYDSLLHDVALQNLHIIIGVDHAGLVGEDGETHNGGFDISFLSSVPGMTIFNPSSYKEMDEMMKAAITMEGPVAIRYPKGTQRAYTRANLVDTSITSMGSDVTLVGYGDLYNEIIAATDQLTAAGISAEVIKISTLKPLNIQPILHSVAKTHCLVVVEDVCEQGSVGEAILSELAGKLEFRHKLLNLGDGIVKHGKVSQLYHLYSLDAEGIINTVSQLMKE